MRGRTPAGREYATHATGGGERLPEGVSMAVETIPVDRIFRGRCNSKHEEAWIALFGLTC